MFKLSLILSLLTLMMSLLLMFNSTLISIKLHLLPILSTNLDSTLILDWTSMLFMSTVLMISSMIMMFSHSYIPITKHNQFSILLLMFISSMIILILSNNMILLILGWDGLGLSSYILVVFYQNHSSSASGTITILSNRLGDITILLSIATMFSSSNWTFNSNMMTMPIMLLLLTAAISKSAQFPLSAWLPAAMAAPTPISALVHSSTLVTAGVYLMIRISNDNHPTIMMTLMFLSSLTAMYSSLSAIWENDMKKIIAMSTLSQIAIMMFSISIGASLIAFFHLITHAFFKSSMFLCAGSMIHNSSYQDMRHMNFTLSSSPLISSMLGMNSLALMGLPFLSGFFSKDSIIEFSLSSSTNSTLSMIMISSISLTSMYTLRMNLMSTKPILKIKPDYTSVNENQMMTPIMTMTPISIFLGASLSWIIMPTQLMLIPNSMKMMMLMSLILGLLLSALMLFKSMKYISMTESSISLWFIHFMSTHLSKPINSISSHSSKWDLTWQEIYGQHSMYLLNTKMSKKINLMMLNSMMILLMISLTPLIMML